MILRVSRSFNEGMKYPRRVTSANPEYIIVIKNNTVKKAWRSTGRLLKKALNEYGKTERRKFG